MQSLLLSLSPSLPDRRTLESVGIGVIASDETSPVSLSHRHDVCIGSRVRGRSIALSVVGTPDSGDFDGVGYSAAGCGGDGVDDIPVVVVDVLAVEGCGVDIRDIDAGAVVSQLSILIASLPPPSARVRELVASIVGVQLIDLLDLAQSQERELILEESVAFALSRSVDGNKNGAFVCVVAVDGGQFDKVSLAVGSHGEIGDDIAIEGGTIHVQRSALCTGERSVDVLGLEVSGVQAAETGQGVVGACAAGADDQVVVHELRLVDAADGGERLGLSGRSVEKAVVAAIVRSEQQSDGCGTC